MKENRKEGGQGRIRHTKNDNGKDVVRIEPRNKEGGKTKTHVMPQASTDMSVDFERSGYFESVKPVSNEIRQSILAKQNAKHEARCREEQSRYEKHFAPRARPDLMRYISSPKTKK